MEGRLSVMVVHVLLHLVSGAALTCAREPHRRQAQAVRREATPYWQRVPAVDSYDNAMAEAFNSLFKAELVRNKGPWKSIDDLEIAVAEYVDRFNHRRLHGEIGLVPPAELETDYYRHNPAPTSVEASVPSLHQTRGETRRACPSPRRGPRGPVSRPRVGRG